ncbi:MAG: DUF4168 domain-containing protein [Deltaproteobacteria bacterium]|nr:MAG: DUF4168 domain-containing protein [Deltaproteobacteria bacterium]
MFTIFNLKNGFFSLFVIGWSLLALTAISVAQEGPKAQTDQQTKVSDADLRAFVKAYVDNQKIRQQYEPSLKDSTDSEKDQQIQDRANAELKKSLAKQNLTVEKYNAIYNQINSDEELRKKALKLVEEERKRSST